jgi:nuclear GTP-binding protein
LKLPSFASVFERSDQRILSEVQPRKELRKTKNGLVQLKGALTDERRVDLEATVDLIDEDSDEDDDISLERKGLVGEMDLDGKDDERGDGDFPANGKEDGSDETGSVHDSEEDEDDIEEDANLDVEEEPAPLAVPLKLSGKRGREVLRAEGGSGKQSSASKKNVSFAPYTKTGIKLKVTTARKPMPVSDTTKRASNLPSLRKSASKRVEARESKVQGDVDAYDFSKYF